MPSAKSSDSGIAEATISPARKFPRNRTKTRTTISAPSTKFVSTVRIARSTKFVRSRKGSTIISGGSDFCIVTIFSLTRFTTSAEFSPFSIITIPPTASLSPLYVKAPYLTALPIRVSATSLISIGMPLTVFITVLEISSKEEIRPMPRIK